MTSAYTLAQIDYLSQEELLSGVIDNIIYESDLLKHLPFKTVLGKSLDYNRELTLPPAFMIARDGTWVSGTMSVTPVSRALTIIGNQVDILLADIALKSETNDPEAIAVAGAGKTVGHLFDRKSIYGNDSSVTVEFDGLHALVSTSAPDMTVTCASAATTPGGLTITKLYEMVDRIKPGSPDFLIMNKTSRRLLSLWAQGTTSNLFEMSIESGLGYRVKSFDSIPILINEWITDTELLASSAFSAETGGSGTGAGGISTSIFAVKLGEEAKGLVGLNSKNGGMDVVDIGILEAKHAIRKRIVWYTALALYGSYSLARLDGIAPATAVAI